MENLLVSWQEFLRGKRRRKDVAEFSLHFLDNVSLLREELEKQTYRHGGYEAFKVNDPKPRDIHKASVRDRLTHHAIYRVLYPYFNRQFIHDSYSCRRDKGTHRAMNRFRDFGRKVSKNHTRTCWVLKGDIRKFFANIDHATLKGILARHIKDGRVLWLLGQVIDSFSSEARPYVGLPLGNLTSQLLINVYMNEFDQFVKRELKIKYYIRYADDFVILDTNKENLEKLIPKFASFLEQRLGLALHPNKLFVKTLAAGVDFLGWVHFPHHRILRPSTRRKMQRMITGESKPESVTSYLGLISHGDTHELAKEIRARHEHRQADSDLHTGK